MVAIPLDDENWKKTISKYIISEYQKINRFLNYEAYNKNKDYILIIKKWKINFLLIIII